MPNFPIRFKTGLELSSADKIQAGALEMLNTEIGRDSVIEKRTGAQLIARTTTLDPNNEIPAEDTRAVFYRERELCLETKDNLFGRRECAGDSFVDQGTATPTEIANTAALLDEYQEPSYDLTIPVTGDAGAIADAFGRLDRLSDAFDPVVLNDGLDSITVTYEATGTGSRLFWTGTVNGQTLFDASNGRQEWGYATLVKTANDVLVFTICEPDPVTPLRVTVRVYEGTLIGGFFLLVNEINEFEVLGNISGAVAVSNSTDGVFVINQLIGTIFVAKVWPTQVSWTMGFNDTVEASASRNVVFDARESTGAPGYFASAAFLRSTGAVPSGSATTVRTFSMPVAPGILGGAVVTTTPTMTTASQVGVAAHTESYTAIRPQTASATYCQRLSGFNRIIIGVLFGDLTHQILTTATNLQIDELINGTFLTRFETSVKDGVNAYQFRAVQLPGGQYVVSTLDNDDNIKVRSYTNLGSVLWETPFTIPEGFAFTLKFDGTYVGFLAMILGPAGTTNHHLYWSSDLALWANDVITGIPPILNPSPQNDGFFSPLDMATEDLGGGEMRLRACQWNADPASPDYQTLHSYSYDTGTNIKSDARTDPVTSFGSNVQIAELQVGTWPRTLVIFEDQNTGVTEIYEVTPTYIVRVVPSTTSLAGGDWNHRGPWTRSDLSLVPTSDWGSVQIREVTSAAITSPSSGGACVLSLLRVTAGPSIGINAVIFGSHTESGGPADPVVLDNTGFGPHVANTRDDQLVLTLVTAAGDLFYQFWQPGISFSLIDTGLDLVAPTTPICDLSAASLEDGTGWAIWMAVDSIDDSIINIRDENSVELLAPFDVSFIPFLVAEKVAVYAITGTEEPAFLVAQTVSDTADANVQINSYTIVSGALTQNWTAGFEISGAEQVRAITVGALDDYATDGLVAVEWFDGVEWVTSVYSVATGSSTLIRDYRQMAIHSGFVEVNGQLALTLSGVGSGTIQFRKGIVLVAPVSGEYIGRCAVGVSEDYVQRNQRHQVNDSNLYKNRLIVGHGIVGASSPSQLTTGSEFADWDFTARPNVPGVAQSVAVSAHGGYPRGYDGGQAFEHDWHQLPQIISSNDDFGGVLTAGSYGIAITYEWTDSQGLLYRSAPAFAKVDVVASRRITAVVRPLFLTERADVTLALWRTKSNGTVYYLTGSQSAISTSNTITISFNQLDASISTNIQLDQVSGGTIGSEPVAISTWVAYEDGRYWSRDPQRPSLVRFSTPTSEGFAPHWNGTLGIESPSQFPVTALAEIDGRVVMFTEADVAITTTGGPDARGVGSYSIPSRIPSSTGCTGQSTLALTPAGVVYGTGTGSIPHIFTRSTQTVEFAGPVALPYDDGEELVVSSWRPDRQELVVSNRAGRQLRWNFASQRWCSDDTRAAVDQAVSRDLDFAILAADGRVLVEQSGDPPVWTDGGTPYRMAYSTPWIHWPTQDQDVHTNGSALSLKLYGTYLGPHGLTVEMYTDYQTEPSAKWFADEATTLARDAYVWQLMIPRKVTSFAVRFRVYDQAEPNPTFRLEGMDLNWEAATETRVLPPSWQLKSV